MTRGVARYLVGSLVVLGLAACGKSWLAERDAWRHEAEVACLKSGQVKETAALVRVQPITGPGICGADFPLKVSALGEGNRSASPTTCGHPAPFRSRASRSPARRRPRRAIRLIRPIRRNSRRNPIRRSGRPIRHSSRLIRTRRIRRSRRRMRPMSIYAPGVAQPEPERRGGRTSRRSRTRSPIRHSRRATARRRAAQPPQAYPSRSYPQPAEQVPLGRERMPVTTGAVAVQPVATLACPIVSALDTWFAGGVQPAAMKWFGVPVAEIKQISAYSCRGMNGQRGCENLRACVRQCARHRVVHARGRAQDHREGRLARAPGGAGLPA